jgi:hypothetical protein
MAELESISDQYSQVINNHLAAIARCSISEHKGKQGLMV